MLAICIIRGLHEERDLETTPTSYPPGLSIPRWDIPFIVWMGQTLLSRNTNVTAQEAGSETCYMKATTVKIAWSLRKLRGKLHMYMQELLAVAVGIRKAWMLKTNLQWGTQRERVRLGCGVIVVATVPLGSWSRSGSRWLNEDHTLLRFLLLDSFCASQLEREIWNMLMSGSGYSYTCMWREEDKM